MMRIFRRIIIIIIIPGLCLFITGLGFRLCICTRFGGRLISGLGRLISGLGRLILGRIPGLSDLLLGLRVELGLALDIILALPLALLLVEVALPKLPKLILFLFVVAITSLNINTIKAYRRRLLEL